MPVPFDELQVGNVYTRVYVGPNGEMTTLSYTGILTGIRPRSDMNPNGPYAIFGNTNISPLDYVFFTPGDPAIPVVVVTRRAGAGAGAEAGADGPDYNSPVGGRRIKARKTKAIKTKARAKKTKARAKKTKAKRKTKTKLRKHK